MFVPSVRQYKDTSAEIVKYIYSKGHLQDKCILERLYSLQPIYDHNIYDAGNILATPWQP